MIINKMAANLIDYSKDILQANQRDLEEAPNIIHWSSTNR
jgi:gamma-glutamyl phosphate reductase